MDALYGNIGGKLKGWALGIFITESIAAVIFAFVLMSADWLLAGFLTLIAGPLVAWVSSWLLYAFGELVEKTAKNEENTAEMVKLLRGMQRKESQSAEKINTAPAPKLTMDDVWYCGNCGKRNLSNHNKCWGCGQPKQRSDNPPHTLTKDNTWICGSCSRQNHVSRKNCWGCNRSFDG